MAARADAAQVNTLVDLYSRHQQRIYRYCLALLRNPDDAEDATQETFTRAAPFLPNLPGDLSAYLTTVARNICCDVVRARARRSVSIEDVPLADRKVSPERQSVDWDVVRRMWRQLSPSERLLFAYTFAGYKYEEIASRTGMSRPSVSVGLARARRRLRDLAAATGTLGLLPVGIRRLLGRASRRTQATLSSAHATVLGMADQVGLLVAGLVAGMFAVSGTPPAAAPAMVPVAAHGTDVSGGALVPRPVAASLPVPAGRLTQDSTATGHHAAPSAPSSVPLLPGGASALLPGSQATPLDTSVDEMAASPSYPSDHTLLVSGSVSDGGCVGGTGPGCYALFRSADAGVSWTRLAYLTYVDGPILLPPAYPSDRAIFMVVTNTGLEESPAGDGTFTLVVPGVSAAAIAPWSLPGHAELATTVGGAMQVYDEGASLPRSSAALPPGMVTGPVAFVAPDTVAVSGWVATATGGGAGAVALCPLSGVCGSPITLPGTPEFPPALATSADVAADHVVVAMAGTAAFVSRDGGASFELVASPPAGAQFYTVSVGGGPVGPRIVLSTTTPSSPQQIRLLSSDDLGRTFTDITGNIGAINPLIGTASFSDGTILAALTANAPNRFALRQTTGNATWTTPT